MCTWFCKNEWPKVPFVWDSLKWYVTTFIHIGKLNGSRDIKTWWGSMTGSWRYTSISVLHNKLLIPVIAHWAQKELNPLLPIYHLSTLAKSSDQKCFCKHQRQSLTEQTLKVVQQTRIWKNLQLLSDVYY